MLPLKKSLFVAGATALLTVLMAGSASAAFFQIGTNITNNGNANVGGQLFVNITDAGNNQVNFQFYNLGSIASVISEIYFDDGTLLGIASVTSGTGTDFSQGANPGNLPGGNGVSPAFVTTANFLASADSPAPQNGVGNCNATCFGALAWETVGIKFNLINGKTFADTLAAMGGDLRIGLHVTGIPKLPGRTGGTSDSYISGSTPSADPFCTNCTTVPDGGMTISLLGMAMAGLGFVARRKT